MTADGTHRRAVGTLRVQCAHGTLDIRAGAERLGLGPGEDVTVGDVRLRRDAEGSTLSVLLRATATDQPHYTSGPDMFRLSTDPRELVADREEADERGLFSLLAFGAIIPPFAPWRSVTRLMPGGSIEIDLRRATHTERSIPRVAIHEESGDSGMALSGQIDAVTCAIDAELVDSCRDGAPVILFSGGVDSGLLAARAAAKGMGDALLINYAFGSGDEEGRHALRMAQHLGLRIERIEHDPSLERSVLEAPRSVYRQPFVDHSTMPTSALARAVIARCRPGSVVLDGTGADGCFGLFGRARQWRKLSRVPRHLLGCAGSLYGATGAWRRRDRAEYMLRILKRASDFGFPAAGIAQNALHGVTYQFDQRIREEVDEAMDRWVEVLCADGPDPARLAAIDLALTCSSIFAQKSKSIFQDSGLALRFPFLSQSVVDLAIGRAWRWPGADRPKHVLREALKRHVPSEMVDRPKSGFVAPLEQRFAGAEFLRAFDEAMSDSSPLAPYLAHARLAPLREEIAAGRSLPPQLATFVWGIAFINRWFSPSDTRTS